jgi:TRAP-type mannitol/chloroaromatic compound transport system substrate-binding protein
MNIFRQKEIKVEAHVIIRWAAFHLATTAVLLGAALSGADAADQKLVLKASDVHPEGYPTVQAVENMGKKLEAANGGRLSIQMYASMQLGGEKEAIEQAQVGALQLARVSVGALGPSSTTSTSSTCRSCFAAPSTWKRSSTDRSARSC